MLELWRARHTLQSSAELMPRVIATAISFVVGWASIHWLLTYLRRHPTYVFVIYRLLLGAAVLALLASGHLSPSAGVGK